MPSERVAETHPLWDLESLARATRLADWMFDQFSWAAKGAAAEVGAGIGTFSSRLLDAGVESLLLIEPDETCVGVLEERFGREPRVRLAREQLPEPPALLEQPGGFDFILCQNVLEHVREDSRAVEVPWTYRRIYRSFRIRSTTRTQRCKG